MPTASEKVPNRALSTTELQDLLRTDFQRLLDNFSLLQSCSAYSRIAWDIRLTLHTEQGTAESNLASRQVAENIISGAKLDEHRRQQPPRPELRVVGDMPVPTPPGTPATTLHRDIDSPNAERLRNGMPVPVERRQSDQTTVTEMIQYPPDETLGAGAVAIDGVPVAGATASSPAAPPDEPTESPEEIKARIQRDAQRIEDARLAAIKAAEEEEQGPAEPIPPVPQEVVDALQEAAADVEELSGAAPPVVVRTRYADGTVKVE